MSEFTTLSLLCEQQPAIESRLRRPEPDSSRVFRNAFLTLLAANIFVISGSLCFGYLYINH
ncbi:MAG: hypothetical protein M3Y72_18480 [Acidobacteriota bacterium]|nr:hypothetical protein [Acidobacteriota bacterium]